MTDFSPRLRIRRASCSARWRNSVFFLRSSARSLSATWAGLTLASWRLRRLVLLAAQTARQQFMSQRHWAPTLCRQLRLRRIRMALVPIIQPPIMKALTTKKERSVVMDWLRPVSKREDSVPDYRYNCCWPDCFRTRFRLLVC